MNGSSASTIIVSILAAIGVAPTPPATVASAPAAITAAHAAIVQGAIVQGAIVQGATITAPDGRPVIFRQA